MRQNQSRFKVRQLVMVALFAAVAFVVELTIHIPVSFLTLDVKDAILILCGLYFGPFAAVTVSVLLPVLELITISTTGFYGLAMNILGSLSFSATASLIYKYKKTFAGAILALCSGLFCMVAVMTVFNLLITPLYFMMPREEVAEMIPTLLLPFNVIKGTLNAGVVLLLYKPLSQALQRTGFLPRSEKKYTFDARTVVVTVVAILLIAASLAVVLTGLIGREF